MKALITLLNDDDTIIESTQIITPIVDTYEGSQRHTVFQYSIDSVALSPSQHCKYVSSDYQYQMCAICDSRGICKYVNFHQENS